MESFIGDAIAWLAAVLVLAGWYFARIGRRIREAKEAKEKALGEKMTQTLVASEVLVRDLGAFIDEFSEGKGRDSSAIHDEESLPHPKSVLRNALINGILASRSREEAAALGALLIRISQFQPNVGPHQVAAFGKQGGIFILLDNAAIGVECASEELLQAFESIEDNNLRIKHAALGQKVVQELRECYQVINSAARVFAAKDHPGF